MEISTLRAQIDQLIEKWRRHEAQAAEWDAKAEAEHDGANAHAFRKERRIWRTCADELAALRASLDVPLPPAGTMPITPCYFCWNGKHQQCEGGACDCRHADVLPAPVVGGGPMPGTPGEPWADAEPAPVEGAKRPSSLRRDTPAEEPRARATDVLPAPETTKQFSVRACLMALRAWLCADRPMPEIQNELDRLIEIEGGVYQTPPSLEQTQPESVIDSITAPVDPTAPPPCVCYVDDGLVQEWISKARAVAKQKGFSVERPSPSPPSPQEQP